MISITASTCTWRSCGSDTADILLNTSANLPGAVGTEWVRLAHMTAVLASLFAHQGGWDEALLVGTPIVIIGVLMVFANRRASSALSALPGGDSSERPSASTESTDPTPTADARPPQPADSSAVTTDTESAPPDRDHGANPPEPRAETEDDPNPPTASGDEVGDR